MWVIPFYSAAATIKTATATAMRDCGQYQSLSKCRRRARPSIFAAAATFLIFSPQPVEASSPPYNAYQYDLTTPQFTPDGRLLQVEYASRAPEQSGPLVAVPVWPSNGDDGEEDDCDGPSVVIASIAARSPSSNDGSKDEDNSPNNDKKSNDLTKSKRKRKGQSRLISLPLGPIVSTPRGAPSTSIPSIVVGLSGILADATSLLGILQDNLTQYRRMYGLGKLHAVLPTHIGDGNTRGPGVALPTSSAQAAPTVVARRVAREVGQKCQLNSFGGGIRPFGASVVICGVDESGACICVTQPSGAVLSSHFLFANPTRKRNAMDNTDEERKVEGDDRNEEMNPSDNIIVIGGDVTLQRRLSEQLANKLSPNGSLRSAVDAVVTSLLEAQGYIENDSLIAQKSTSLDDDITDLEIVIARSDGSYKLTTEEVGAIIDRVAKGGDAGVT